MLANNHPKKDMMGNIAIRSGKQTPKSQFYTFNPVGLLLGKWLQNLVEGGGFQTRFRYLFTLKMGPQLTSI